MSIIGWTFLPTTVIVDYKFPHDSPAEGRGAETGKSGTAVVFLLHSETPSEAPM